MKLKKILKSPKWKLICVDLDGTLSQWEFRGWAEPKPIQPMIDYINSIYLKWWHIIIYTARNPDRYRVTMAWLIKYWVYFHWIAMQMKPWASCYIDDKALNIKDILWKQSNDL
jgi:hypothetical protein